MGKITAIVEGVTVVANGLGKVLSNEDISSTLFGTYSDGRPRSLPDCLNEEIMSPKQKAKAEKSRKKRKKKNKKKSKKKIKRIIL